MNTIKKCMLTSALVVALPIRSFIGAVIVAFVLFYHEMTAENPKAIRDVWKQP